ncbi:MAG: ergothioneine biosynthesis protein EgtC [Actinomycetota bacterium]|nr:ergothioneine biosynthesis protein EgtC [Actinomycetota bacterium]
MCRHLGWLGAPRSLSALVLEPPHSLRRQSWAPRRQRYGAVNADGWGVGFFVGDLAVPARWRSVRPLWGATSFPSVAPHLVSGCVVAAVRSASAGMPLDETAVAPFLHAGWLVSHNGRVSRAVLPVERDAESMCDAALLAAYAVAQGVDRLVETVPTVAADDPTARLNLLLADGTRILATTWGDTLSYRVEDDGVVVASEPFDDDPAWVDVPDRQLVEVTSAGVALTPLEPRR